MKVIEHLTKDQLQAYAADFLAQSQRGEVGRHLLQCAICRDSLPAPTPEQFWSALLVDETEGEESFEAENLSPARSPFSTVFSVFRQPLALGASALILIASISLLIWLGAAKQSDSGREVVQTVETPKFENIPPRDEKLPVSTGDEDSKIESQENPRRIPLRKQSNNNLPADAEDSKKLEKTEDRELAGLLKNTPPAVSSLRSNAEPILRSKADDNIAPAKSFALVAPVSVAVLETMPEFRWEKVKDATSYRISIFDAQFNEVLTAEVTENRFQPDKPLKRGEKYLWRVAAITLNGEIIAPRPPQPPVMFRVAEEKTEKRINSLKKSENGAFNLAAFYSEEGMLDLARNTLREILAANPRHRNARKLLKQVEKWQKENQDRIQRCESAPTATKADQ